MGGKVFFFKFWNFYEFLDCVKLDDIFFYKDSDSSGCYIDDIRFMRILIDCFIYFRIYEVLNFVFCWDLIKD